MKELDLQALAENLEEASEDKADLFDFYNNNNWNKLVLEIERLREKKLFSVHHEYVDTTYMERTLSTDKVLFVLMAENEGEALLLAKAAQISVFRDLGIWTVEEANDKVVRCKP